MNIKSKYFVLMPRHLRKFNGSTIEMFGDEKGQLIYPYVSASSCIDWSLPGQCIFERKRSLAENTMKRIARGFKKFVQDEANPFIVRIGQTGFGGDKLSYSLNQPLTTIMVNNTRHSGSSLKSPLPTITTAGNQALVSTFLEKEEDTLAASYLVKHYGGNYSGAGIDLRNPCGYNHTSRPPCLGSSFLDKVLWFRYRSKTQ